MLFNDSMKPLQVQGSLVVMQSWNHGDWKALLLRILKVSKCLIEIFKDAKTANVVVRSVLTATHFRIL